MYPFERFTERAKKVLTLAQEEAERSHHSYIGTEHLLLGILREGEGLAAKVLNNLGVEINKVRATIESVLGRNERIIIQQIIPTSRVKKVIEIAFEQAREMGNNYVGTEHLLLGLLVEGEGIAAHILEDLGASLEMVRGEIDSLIQIMERAMYIDDLDRLSTTQMVSKTPVLDDCGRDLTDLAARNRLSAPGGRELEINRVIEILSQLSSNHPVIVAEAAFSRSAIVEGVACDIVLGKIPDSLRGRRLVSLDKAKLLANAQSRGTFTERLVRALAELIDEIRSSRDVVLVIEELGPVLSGSAFKGATEIAAVLRPALARDDFPWMGTCSSEDFGNYLSSDADLKPHFEAVYLEAPTMAEKIEQFRRLKKAFEMQHRVRISDEAVKAVAVLSDWSPVEAGRLIDKAAARLRMQLTLTPSGLLNLREEIGELQTKKEEALANQDYESAASFRDKEKKLKDKYVKEEMEWRDSLGKTVPVVTADHITNIARGKKTQPGIAKTP